MALFPEFGVENAPTTPEQALRLPVGVASPLWFAFAGAASAGVAYWLMTRWAKPVNLEAFGGWFDTAAPEAPALPKLVVAEPVAAAAVEVEEVVEVVVEQAQAKTIETAEAVAETVETVTELAVETVEPVQEAAAEVVEQTVATVEAAADDLTRIVGIGPKLAVRLADLGVKSFSDLAGWTADDLARFDKDLDLKGRAVRDAWVVQAKRFAKV